MEQLQSETDLEDEDDVNLALFDVQGKREIVVAIDRESKRYSNITVKKNHR